MLTQGVDNRQTVMSETTIQAPADIHKAFAEVIEAMVSLENAKTKLANIHYHTKNVDDAEFLLNNIGRFASPSDDAHEVLFERLQAAKELARVHQSKEEISVLKGQLASAYLSIERAYKILKA